MFLFSGNGYGPRPFTEATYAGCKRRTCCQAVLFVRPCHAILQPELPKQLDYPCLPCVSPAHALPMFREARQRSTRKQLEKDRLDPKKSHKPEPPVSGPGNIQLFLFSFFPLTFIGKKEITKNIQPITY